MDENTFKSANFLFPSVDMFIVLYNLYANIQEIPKILHQFQKEYHKNTIKTISLRYSTPFYILSPHKSFADDVF